MGQEWLTKIAELLEKAGIASGEEYAAAPVPAISQPVAAVGLRGLNWGKGTATVSVRILSPRSRGGWACQTTAAKAVTVLEEAGIPAGMEQMEYRRGCNCFETVVTGTMRVRELPPDPVQPPAPVVRRCWQVRCGAAELTDVTEFEELQDLNRRLIGAHGQQEPVGITPGSGGLELRMVREIPAGQAEQDPGTEPMELRVIRSGTARIYTGVCWSRVKREYAGQLLRVEYRGFALKRRTERVE